MRSETMRALVKTYRYGVVVFPGAAAQLLILLRVPKTDKCLYSARSWLREVLVQAGDGVEMFWTLLQRRADITLEDGVFRYYTFLHPD